MISIRTMLCTAAALALPITAYDITTVPVYAQDVAAASPAPDTTADDSQSALTEDELEQLVARFALYPDDLVALITAASLFPLQIVEAQRFLEKKTADEQPDPDWDGSVISLLNYPDIVKMMSDDLGWTQELGNAIAYQQKDVLIAIQQLRDEAVAGGAIKTDEKLTVTSEGDNVVIQSASADVVYIPQYPPEMFYEPGYDMEPVGYYPDPYPYYWSPAATYFAGVVTGAAWAAIVDWDDWGVWGGDDWGDIDINCDHCFNDLNGRVNINDIDWRNVDRDKISFDKDQFNDIGKRTDIKNSIKTHGHNDIGNKAASIKRGEVSKKATAGKIKDVRASANVSRPGAGGEGVRKPGFAPSDKVATRGTNKANLGQGGAGTKKAAATKAGSSKKKATKPKAGAKVDHRTKKPSGLGEVRSGKAAKVHSSKGHKAMRSGGSHKSVSRGGGGSRHGGGRGGGGRGGGHRR